MKKIIAMFMIILGGIACLWGGYNLFAGVGLVKIPFTETLVQPMMVGLAGVAMFTMGLIGYRD
ncbi:MAG: hypothetical protein C0467_03110 [Planctomycetaceae bacterium]|nr:hypothetical protein [Planctomycetaceae bacterium]